jgi:predicted nucleotidyltransferase component of viral defense system
VRRPRDVVELFHLHFLRQLAAGRSKDAYVVKGGCNLRFFFGSLRYSEDLDIDTAGPSVGTLRDHVDRILASKVLTESLESLRVELARVSSPKQTETTQRWKIQLLPHGSDLPLSSKVEFSRRATEESGVLDAVDARLVRRYRLMPLLLCHYPLPAAIRQKVGALVHRREVQARDVFDLSVLLSRFGEEPVDLGLSDDLVPRAVDRVLELGYEDYLGQVVAYLEPDRSEELASRAVWESIQFQVIESLECPGGRAT